MWMFYSMRTMWCTKLSLPNLLRKLERCVTPSSSLTRLSFSAPNLTLQDLLFSLSLCLFLLLSQGACKALSPISYTLFPPFLLALHSLSHFPSYSLCQHFLLPFITQFGLVVITQNVDNKSSPSLQRFTA